MLSEKTRVVIYGSMYKYCSTPAPLIVTLTAITALQLQHSLRCVNKGPLQREWATHGPRLR